MRQWLFGICLAAVVAAPALAATDRLPADAVLVDAAPRVGTHVLDKLAAVPADDALTQLEAIADPAVREATAAALLDRLQQQHRALPDTLLDGIARWPVRMFRRHEETRADWFLPVFDLPTQVQSLRRLASRAQGAKVLQATLLAKSDAEAWAALAAAEPEIAAAAVRTAPLASLARLEHHAKASATPLPSAALAALAERLRSSDSVLAAIDLAAPVDVLPLFASTVPALPAANALAVLQVALLRADYASAAAAALAQLPRTPGNEAVLRDAFAHPTLGASVAAALARQPDGIARIDAWLADGAFSDATEAGIALTHLALALRLRGDADAERRLLQMLDDPRLPANVRAELQR